MSELFTTYWISCLKNLIIHNILREDLSLSDFSLNLHCIYLLLN